MQEVKGVVLFFLGLDINVQVKEWWFFLKGWRLRGGVNGFFYSLELIGNGDGLLNGSCGWSMLVFCYT